MEDSDIRQKAYDVCKNYIGGIWKAINPEDIIMEKMSGGCVNTILKLTLANNIKPIEEEPTTVIMRNITGVLGCGQFGIMTENIVATLLAEKKLGPKVYGIFNGGRLDEFVPSRVLVSSDFNNPHILEEITKKLAQIHALNPPLKKDPDFIFKLWDHQIKAGLKDIDNQIKNIPERKEAWDIFLTWNPHEEWNWLMRLKDLSNSRIVFGHNDFCTSNILLRDGRGGDWTEIIDFEMAGYNYRGFDLASLFFSFCLDPVNGPPYFKVTLDNFPDLEQQESIAKIYLLEFQKSSGMKLNTDNELKQLLKEFKVFIMIFTFMWIVFCIFTPHRSKEPLDWMSQGQVMIQTYPVLKKKFKNDLNWEKDI